MSEEARRTLRYGEPLSEARTPLADFFSILLGHRSPTFFATVSRGKATLSIGERRNVFSQGDAADAVFYIQEGKVKLAVISYQGGKPEPALAKISQGTLVEMIGPTRSRGSFS